MAAEELQRLRDRKWLPSRIPALDALSIFVPEGQEESDPAVIEMRARIGSSRWYPVPGGHKVSFPYEGGDYDHERFALEKGAWDHEHCKVCNTSIPPTTSCWVTQSGKYIILCESCYSKAVVQTPLQQSPPEETAEP
jgi:hypothetical protein